jgi:hypothetical protein
MLRRTLTIGVGFVTVALSNCGGDDSNKARHVAAGGEAAEGGDAGQSAGPNARAGESSSGAGEASGGDPSAGAGKAGETNGGSDASGGAGGPDSSGGGGAGNANGGGGEDNVAGSTAGAAGAASTCDLGEATSAGTQQNLDLFGTIVYFANGDALPAGRYRATYVDGCMKYGGSQDWTIHAYAPNPTNHNQWWFVGDTSDERIVTPPGTSGYGVANGAYAAFEDCVSANLALEPMEFDFSGGKIGVWLEDSPYTDNVAGQDGRNPKWQLTLLEPCLE